LSHPEGLYLAELSLDLIEGEGLRDEQGVRVGLDQADSSAV
jgi:hypothetical protein